jgi:CPSF A subunit region
MYLSAAGAMLPFMSREDVDFFVHLEMYLRQENPPLCGRDHLAFRSAYFPVKDVVDGDLCEQYAQVRAGPAAPCRLATEDAQLIRMYTFLQASHRSQNVAPCVAYHAKSCNRPIKCAGLG